MQIPALQTVHATTPKNEEGGAQSTVKKITDGGITSAVEDELIFESEVSPIDVDVSTSQGIVTLLGSVDNLFAKDKLFAYLTLEDHELALYERVHDELEVPAPVPDLVIFLQAGIDTLVQRIQQRGKPYEREIRKGYLDELNAAYTHFFFHYTASPLLVVNTSDIDFVNRPADLDQLVKAVREAKGGMQYYVPLGSGK